MSLLSARRHLKLLFSVQSWLGWQSLIPSGLTGCTASKDPSNPCAADSAISRGMGSTGASTAGWEKLTFPFNVSVALKTQLSTEYPASCTGEAAANKSCFGNESSVLAVSLGDEIRLANPCNGQANARSNATNAFFVGAGPQASACCRWHMFPSCL